MELISKRGATPDSVNQHSESGATHSKIEFVGSFWNVCSGWHYWISEQYLRLVPFYQRLSIHKRCRKYSSKHIQNWPVSPEATGDYSRCFKKAGLLCITTNRWWEIPVLPNSRSVWTWINSDNQSTESFNRWPDYISDRARYKCGYVDRNISQKYVPIY